MYTLMNALESNWNLICNPNTILMSKPSWFLSMSDHESTQIHTHIMWTIYTHKLMNMGPHKCTCVCACVRVCMCKLVTLCRALLTKFAKWLQTPPMGGNPPGLRHTHTHTNIGGGATDEVGTWGGTGGAAVGGWGLCWLCEREFNVLGATATIMQFSEMTPACAAESATTTTTTATTAMTLMTTTMAMAMTMIITMIIMIIAMMTTLGIVSTAVQQQQDQRRIAFERQ